MKSKEELVKEYLTTITHRLSADYDLSLDDAVKAVESLDLFNIYKGYYDFLLHEDISTWVNIAYDNYRLKFNRPLFLTPTLKQAIKDIEKHTEINNSNHLKEEKKVLKKNIMENYIVINGKKSELTEEQLNYLCMFNRFAQMAKEQFGLTITPKEPTGETFKTLFGVDFSVGNMSKEVENTISFIKDIKKQAYKEILKSLDDKLCDCAIISDGEYCGYYCSDIRDILRELENEYEIHS